MKGFIGGALVLLLIAGAIAGGVALERMHADGQISYPWESASTSIVQSSGSEASSSASSK